MRLKAVVSLIIVLTAAMFAVVAIWEGLVFLSSPPPVIITETQITKYGYPYSAYDPDISGNTIVWEDNRNVFFNIFMYDLSTSKKPR